jgi:hypothetical protein
LREQTLKTKELKVRSRTPYFGGYCLDENGVAYKVEDADKVAAFFYEGRQKFHKKDQLNIQGKDLTVSTIFLGIDHGHCQELEPVLWESAIIEPHEGEEDEFHIVQRYCSKDEAYEGHNLICEALKKHGMSYLGSCKCIGE